MVNTRHRRNRNRKASRKANRKASRKNVRRNMRGGNGNATGAAPVNYNLAGSSPSQMSLAQGNQYASYHTNQHGGVAPYPGEVVSSGLPAELHATARIAPLDGYFNDIRGLKDPNQMGAGRKSRKTSRKSRKTSRKTSRKSRKSRKGSRKTNRKSRKSSRKSNRRSMKGGAAVYNPDPASVSAPGLLLDPSTEAKAIRGMNPEWYLAPDPNAFAPKA